MGEDKPFDAGEAYWSEDPASERSEWRTVSLVTALRTLLEPQSGTGDGATGANGSDSRREAFTRAADELTRRGIDADALVRYGMPAAVVTALFAPVVAKFLIPNSALEESGLSLEIEDDPWLAAILPEIPKDTPDELTEEQKREAIASAFENISLWLSSAPIEVLIRLDPPSANYAEYQKIPTPKKSVLEQYKWIADRFSETFLAGWHTESLHLEYRWMTGKCLAPCPESLMSDRLVTLSELSAEITKRAVFRANDEPAAEVQLSGSMRSYAVALLQEQRYREAAVLYEFALQRDPENAEATNNLGFCVFGEDVKSALKHFVEAARLGYKPVTINTYNQVCCHVRLGDVRTALRVAEEGWQSVSAEERRGGCLWTLGVDDEWTVIDVSDTLRELVKLMAQVAAANGLSGPEEHWKSRLKALGSGLPDT